MGEFMNFDDYQLQLDEFAKYPETGQMSQFALTYCALGLTGEAGEYSEKVKKWLRDGAFEPAEAAKELGDVLWYLARSAQELGYSLSEIAQMNIQKLTSRKARGVLGGSGDSR